MFYLYVILLLTMFVSGMWVFSYKREHVLSMLLSLEYMVITVYFITAISIYYYDVFYSLVYLTFAACEGALGLSVLVMMSRTHGGDYFKSFSIMMN